MAHITSTTGDAVEEIVHLKWYLNLDADIGIIRLLVTMTNNSSNFTYYIFVISCILYDLSPTLIPTLIFYNLSELLDTSILLGYNVRIV